MCSVFHFLDYTSDDAQVKLPKQTISQSKPIAKSVTATVPGKKRTIDHMTPFRTEKGDITKTTSKFTAQEFVKVEKVQPKPQVVKPKYDSVLDSAWDTLATRKTDVVDSPKPTEDLSVIMERPDSPDVYSS